jgi:hypothetical protein
MKIMLWGKYPKLGVAMKVGDEMKKLYDNSTHGQKEGTKLIFLVSYSVS